MQCLHSWYAANIIKIDESKNFTENAGKNSVCFLNTELIACSNEKQLIDKLIIVYLNTRLAQAEEVLGEIFEILNGKQSAIIQMNINIFCKPYKKSYSIHF